MDNEEPKDEPNNKDNNKLELNFEGSIEKSSSVNSEALLGTESIGESSRRAEDTQ